MSQILNRSHRPESIRLVFKGEVDDVDKAKRTVKSIITTDGVDHYKEVILARGINLEIFRTNPVVLWCHQANEPIGKNLWIKRFTKDGKSGLLALTKFGRSKKADEVFEMYADGILNGWSIGANPDWSVACAPTEDELKARPDWKKCRTVYRKSTLLEYSACAIPANPDCLGNEAERHISAELRREIDAADRWPEPEPGDDSTDARRKMVRELPPLNPLPPLVGRTFGQALSQTRAAIAALTSKSAAEQAASEAIDRAKGRV